MVISDWSSDVCSSDHGSIDLIPIIETGKGMQAVHDIAAAGTRTRRMSFGAGDFTLDMNLDWPLDESTLSHARASIVQASRAAGIEPPLDTVWIHVKDLENLEKSTRLAKQMGFQGKLCLYPPLVAAVNRVFQPPKADVAPADTTAAAFA